MEILGIRVDNLTMEQARDKARAYLNLSKQCKIFTPNPEFVVKAQKDKYFREVLNAGDLNFCDGFGLHFFSGAPRITGVDFAMELCKIAAEEGKSVFLLGGLPGAAQKAGEKLVKQFSGLKIAGWEEGPKITEHVTRNTKHNNSQRLQVTGYMLNVDAAKNEDLINKINSGKAAILFVAFGMGKQEKWVAENLTKLPDIKIAMGVGGALDYISGLVPRAPLFFRQIGLEWMYRVIIQPKRFFRIINATAVFTFLVIRDFLISKQNKL